MRAGFAGGGSGGGGGGEGRGWGAGVMTGRVGLTCPASVLSTAVWVKSVDTDQPAAESPTALGFLTTSTKPTVCAVSEQGEGSTKRTAAIYMER